MPSEFRGQKTLHQWIELDYHERPRKLRRWRTACIWGVFLISVAGVVAAVLTPQASKLYQAGNLTQSHAMFNHDCKICHLEAFATAKKLVNWSSDLKAVPDQACVRCHEGPPHNSFVKTEVRCAECHREHEGRQALAQVSDDHCIRCHADLKANHIKPQDCTLSDVSGFPEGHPPIRKLTDPGRLRFNHKTHLALQNEKTHYGAVIEKLNCIDCHQFDEAGKFMKPIHFESHCQKCHPIQGQLAGELKDEALKKAVLKFNKELIPHESPRQVRAVLRDRLLSFIQDHPVIAKEVDNLRALPKPRRSQLATEKEWALTNQKLSENELRLFAELQLEHNKKVQRGGGACLFCHFEQKPRDPKKIGDPGPLLKIVPPLIPTRWMDRARFNHEAHRMLKCTECHGEVAKSERTSDVLMPKLDTCKKCHSPSVGARHDCAECHTYHDHDLSGNPIKDLTIQESLKR